jgi:hypothetical protein
VLEVGAATGHTLDRHIGESSVRIHRGGRKVDAAAGNHQRRVKRRRAGNLYHRLVVEEARTPKSKATAVAVALPMELAAILENEVVWPGLGSTSK